MRRARMMAPTTEHTLRARPKVVAFGERSRGYFFSSGKRARLMQKEQVGLIFCPWVNSE